MRWSLHFEEPDVQGSDSVIEEYRIDADFLTVETVFSKPNLLTSVTVEKICHV